MKISRMETNRSNVQSGFTLIELIVVIVILGILAATALPKFASLGADARLASLNTVKSALRATSTAAHGQYLANTSGTPLVNYTPEGQSIPYFVVSGTGIGYLTGDPINLPLVAGLQAGDYLVVGSSASTSATANSPALAAGEIAFIPKSVAGTVTGLLCYVKYTQGTTSATPVISEVSGGTTAPATNPC